MDYQQAKRVGDAGERMVAEELERLAPLHGLTVLHDVLLQVGPMTAQLDHVVLDRFGVLILESKVRTGALIRGSDVQKQWTACYPGHKNMKLQNPLMQNREHENAVRQALRDVGNPLNPDYVKSAVVFVGADLSALELDSFSRSRVVDVSQLQQIVRERHEFALNAGDLSAEGIAALAGLLRGLDRSKDQNVVQKHASYRQGSAPAPPVSNHRNRSSAHASGSASNRTAGLQRRLRRLIVDLIPISLAMIFLYWLVWGSGMAVLGNLISWSLRPSSSAVEQVPEAGVSSPTVSVERAKQVLLETAPDKYGNVVNIDQPVVTEVTAGTTFTWEYVSNPAANIAEVKTIALTLDPAGNLIGVDIR